MPKKELFYKAHDSIYALQILFFPHISLNDLSEKITYFVVYNNESIEEKENESIHFNKFKEKLKESFREREELPVFWGLDLYEGELYKKIYTLDARQFEEEFLSEIYDA